MGARRRACALLLGAALPAVAAGVHLEELTTVELRERIAAGATTVLVPIGGTEQNGPHLVLGKHNVRVRWLAALIARQLGQSVVAPVVAYVPEGAIEPPAAHMRWAGTISVPVPAFEAVLEATARSLCRHGLRDVVFLGDHGSYRASLQRVAARLDRPDCRAHALPEYYHASSEGFRQLLAARGFTAAEIGSHAGLADTALALAADPGLVRGELQAKGPGEGVSGDPRRATAELGRAGAELIVAQSVAALRQRLPAAAGTR